MNTPEDLRRLAERLLKGARVPQRGPQFQRVLKTPEALGGAVVHYAAWLLHHSKRIQLSLKSIPEPYRAAVASTSTITPA